MKRALPLSLITLLLASCGGWIIQPIPGNVPTPFLPPTQLPSVFSPTPVIIGVTSVSPTSLAVTFTSSTTPFPTITSSPSTQLTFTPSSTFTSPPPSPGILIQVLGCNTSIDISHGMGEVTNAFVTLKNTGGVELTNVRATLFALDEGREHPDKTVELVSLPVGNQVTIKLTVDSTYKQESPIQVEVISDQGVFPREGLASCREIGLLIPDLAGLNTPVPSTP